MCAVTVRLGEELRSLVPLLLVFRALQPLGCNPFLMGVDFVPYLVGYWIISYPGEGGKLSGNNMGGWAHPPAGQPPARDFSQMG